MSNLPFEAALVQSIGWALVHFIWQGTLIGAVVAIALRALTGAPSTTRYSVCCLGLTSMFLAPVWSIVTGRSVNDVNVVADAANGIVFDLSAVDRLLSVAVVVWGVGVLLLSIRLAASCIGIERLKRVTSAVDVQVAARVQTLSRRLGIRRSVQVFESALVQVPTIVGWLRPVILLPVSVASSLPVSHLDAVIAHELAHVRRHDYLINALQSIVETLLFYHPAVWWCSRQIRVEREHCCDDLVVEACGDRVAYASALARLEELRGVEPMLSLNMTGGRLVDRIRRLLSERSSSARTPLTWTIATAFAIAVAAIVATPALTTADEGAEAQDRFDIALQVEQMPDVPVPPEALDIPLPPAAPMVPAIPAPPALQAVPRLPAVPAAPVVPDVPALPALPAVPDLPAFPYSLRMVPAPPAPPAAPALPAPATPAAPLAMPVPPSPLAVPAPPAPPTLFPGQVGVGGDDVSQLARELTDASQRLFGGFAELRKAAQDLAEKQMQLQMAQAEVEKMRAAALGTTTQIAALQKALGEMAANGALLKDLKPEVAEMQKKIEAMRKSLEQMRSR
jgi:beta-lactamase regulating signal transducer with metallopeptidase domain